MDPESVGASWEGWAEYEPHPEICACGDCVEAAKERKLWKQLRNERKSLTMKEMYDHKYGQDRSESMTMREFWEIREQARDVARRAGALKDEVRMSEKHAGAKKQTDGSWVCTVCKAESFDAEMFEQAGDDFGCMKLAVKQGLRVEEKKASEFSGVINARRWIEAAKAISSSGTHDRAGAYEDAMRMSYKNLGRLGTATASDRAILNELARKHLDLREEIERMAEAMGGIGAALPVEALMPKVAVKGTRKPEPFWNTFGDHNHGTHFQYSNEFKRKSR